MNKAYFIFAATALIGITGCNRTHNNPTPVDNKINITTGIDAITKAPQLGSDGSGTFSDGDTFTLFVAGTSQSETLAYTYGQTELYWDNLNVTSDNGTLLFSACYPQQQVVNGNFTFDLTNTSSPDLLIAMPQIVSIGTAKNINMRFKHAMHRLVVNFTSDGSYDIDKIATTCTAKSSCTVNLNTGTIDNSDATTSEFSASGAKATFVLIPQTASDVTLKVTAGNDTRTFILSELPDSKEELEGGKQMDVNLTIKDGKIYFEDFTIEGWGDQGSIEGDIIM